MSIHVDSIGEVASVLQELRRGEGGAESAARVATMNFLVFVDDPAWRDWVVERALKVVGKHPARLILLDSTGATTGLGASIASREINGATVLNERVDVGVRDLDHAEILSVAQELTVHEVPTIVWWSGARLLQSRTFAGLVQLATEVIVDSSGAARDEETIRELCEFVTRYSDVTLNDLAFMRLAPWMDMIAQFFDDPALRDDLFSINGVRIESGSVAEALYLAAWLGSSLSWEPLGATSFRARGGRHVNLERIAAGDQRRVRRVVLTTDDSTFTACVSDDDENVACLIVEGAKARPTTCTPLQAIGNTSLIERAFLSQEHNHIFETSLMTVRGLLR